MQKLILSLQKALFPEYYGAENGDLEGLNAHFTKEQADIFRRMLPDIRQDLQADLQAVLARDPAAESAAEVALCYPGFYAVTVHRLAHGLYGMKVPLLPRRMAEQAHSVTGIDIHPGAVIGPGFFIDHGTGVVIGETAVIGRDVTLYHGVTLGATVTKRQLRGIKRHPTLEDGVTVYANTTILGGDTVIGQGSVIGAGAFVTRSVPPDSIVSVRHPELIVR